MIFVNFYLAFENAKNQRFEAFKLLCHHLSLNRFILIDCKLVDHPYDR